MTEFVQVDGANGGLFVPAELARQPRCVVAAGSASGAFAHHAGADVAAMGEQEVIAGLAASREMRARADAWETHLLVRLDQLRGRDRYVPDEAALELRISRRRPRIGWLARTR